MELALTFTSIIVVNVLAWLTPGPNMVAVMSAAMSDGRRSGLLAVAGHSVTATVFSTRLIVGFFNRARRALSAVFGLVFAGLGLGVAYDALRRV